MDFLPGGTAKLWLKLVSKKPGYTIAAQEIECGSKRIRQTSSVEYDSAGTPLKTLSMGSGWQPIIPDSLGEQLYTGVCAP